MTACKTVVSLWPWARAFGLCAGLIWRTVPQERPERETRLELATPTLARKGFPKKNKGYGVQGYAYVGT